MTNLAIETGLDMLSKPGELAPEIVAREWLNTTHPVSFSSLRQKVIVVHAFQMLCPECVSHGIPQANAIYSAFPRQSVEVIGLHSVFKHHSVMTSAALAAFVHEYRLAFPIAIDEPGATDVIPVTMRRYQMQGTPTLLLIDCDLIISVASTI